MKAIILSTFIFLSISLIVNAQPEIIRLTDLYEDYKTSTLQISVIEVEGTANEIKEAAKSWVIKNFGTDAIINESSSSLTFELEERLSSEDLGFNKFEGNKFKMIFQARDQKYKITILDAGATLGENKDKPLSTLFQEKQLVGKKELTGAEYITSKEGYDYKVILAYQSKLDSMKKGLQNSVEENLDW